MQPVGGDHLGTGQAGVGGAHEPAAQPALHHPGLTALLALVERRRAVRALVREPRQGALNDADPRAPRERRGMHATAGPIAVDVHRREVDTAQPAVEQPADVRVAIVGTQRELEVLVSRYVGTPLVAEYVLVPPAWTVGPRRPWRARGRHTSAANSSAGVAWQMSSEQQVFTGSSPSRFSKRRASRPAQIHLRLAPAGGDARWVGAPHRTSPSTWCTNSEPEHSRPPTKQPRPGPARGVRGELRRLDPVRLNGRRADHFPAANMHVLPVRPRPRRPRRHRRRAD